MNENSATSGNESSLGAKIRQAREVAGFSIRQLASMVGTNFSVLSRIESGQVLRPSAETLQNIASVLELDEAELLSFIGVRSKLPEPKTYFRRAYGMSEAEAVEAEQIINELRKRHGERGSIT